MVEFSNADRVEEILYGDPSPERCEVIAELHGVMGNLGRNIVDERLKEYFGHSYTVKYDKPIEIRWERDRVDYQSLKRFDNDMMKLLMNEFSGNPFTRFQVVRESLTKEQFDKFPMEAMGREMREHDLFLKPADDEFVAQSSIPRPKILFELQYNVPRGGSLDDIVDDMREKVSEGLMGSIGTVEKIEDRGSIILFPLPTLVDTSDYDILDFDMSGIAEEMAEKISAKEIRESPRLERVIVTCDMIGR